jgi:hypothetical protein
MSNFSILGGPGPLLVPPVSATATKQIMHTASSEFFITLRNKIVIE